MTWFDKLKKVVDVNLDLRNLINVTINYQPNISKPYTLTTDGKQLEINLANLPENKIEEVTQQFISEGNKLLEKKASNLLHELYDYNKQSPDVAVLAFFKPIISSQDYETLEASLFLRQVFKKHGDVRKIKADIRKRFGDRGNNIANLCSANYFESFLIPLYNESSEMFRELYEIIVGKSILAVFVHGEMEEAEITTQIHNKLEISKRYGIKFIHIHGIGSTNIKKVKDYVRLNEESLNFLEKKIFEKENIIILELIRK